MVGWSAAPGSSTAAGLGCEPWVAAVDEIWSPARRTALHARTEASPRAKAYVTTTLDDLVDAWKASATALCEQDQAPAPSVAERRCHEAWLQGLERSVALLVERGDGQTLAGAPDLLDRLVATQGGYCALQPSPAVDPEVWRLAESAREAAIVGDAEHAQRQASAALVRAQSLDDSTMTAHLAEAHAAQAEVLARGGDIQAALEQFASAERHAIGAEVPQRLLQIRLLWAKVLALTGDPIAGQRAADHLRQAEPLAFALDQDQSLTFTAELAEARGMVERTLGNYETSIAQHRAALAHFEQLDRHVLVARAWLGIGASYQWLERSDQAVAAYVQAESIYAELGVPPRYRNRIRVHLNLGMLGLSTEHDGIPALEFVMEHGTADERLQAIAYAIAQIDDRQQMDLAAAWSELALTELGQRSATASPLVFDVQLTTGATLAMLDDPRGRPLLEQAERTAQQLAPIFEYRAQQTFIDWLRSAGHCNEAKTRLAALDARLAAEPTAPTDIEAWRSALSAQPCSPRQPIP